MEYKKMIKAYADAGGDEKKMWASVDVTAEAMDLLKELAPEKYECFMRKMSETLYGKHYSEELALSDVEAMHSVDKTGAEHHGAHWTLEQVETATSGKPFAKGVTKYDKFVAYNYGYHVLADEFSDEEILKIVYAFFFKNGESEKIWKFYSKSLA